MNNNPIFGGCPVNKNDRYAFLPPWDPTVRRYWVKPEPPEWALFDEEVRYPSLASQEVPVGYWGPLHRVRMVKILQGITAFLQKGWNAQRVKILAAWQLTGRLTRDDVVAIATVTDGQSKTHTKLVHLPVVCGEDYHFRRINTLPVMNDPIAVVVPYSCRLSTLQSFLDYTRKELMKVAGAKKMVLAWGLCAKSKESPALQLQNIKQFVQKWNSAVVSTGKETKPQLILSPMDIAFSRGPVLVEALKKLSKKEVVVVLDVDMRVKSDYFIYCRAFTANNKGAYFPVTFARYNPNYIMQYAGLMNKKTLKAKVKDQGKVDVDLGTWRRYGFGMVAANAEIIPKWGWYDASIHGWGMEDINMYRNYTMSGKMMIWRMFDKSIVHVYHPKECDPTSGKYGLCLESKFKYLGNDKILAAILHENKG